MANPLTDLQRRVTELEKRKINVDDLPQAQLKRWLESSWQPNASDIILPRTIGRDLLARDSITSEELEQPEPGHLVGGAGEPAFQNSWTNFGAPYAGATFYKDPFGIVRLEGLVNRGALVLATGSAIFTLPVGYRPSFRRFLAAYTSGARGTIRIETSGIVTMEVGAVGGGGGSSYLSLEDVTFRAA